MPRTPHSLGDWTPGGPPTAICPVLLAHAQDRGTVHAHIPWENLPRVIESRAQEALSPLPHQPTATLPFLIWLRDRYTHGDEDFAVLATCRGAFPVIAGWTFEEVQQRVRDSRAGRQGFVWVNAVKAARCVPIASCLRVPDLQGDCKGLRLQGDCTCRACQEQRAGRLLHLGLHLSEQSATSSDARSSEDAD